MGFSLHCAEDPNQNRKSLVSAAKRATQQVEDVKREMRLLSPFQRKTDINPHTEQLLGWLRSSYGLQSCLLWDIIWGGKREEVCACVCLCVCVCVCVWQAQGPNEISSSVQGSWSAKYMCQILTVCNRWSYGANWLVWWPLSGIWQMIMYDKPLI